MTLTPVAARLAVELSIPYLFNDLGLWRLGLEHPAFRISVERFNNLRYLQAVHYMLF